MAKVWYRSNGYGTLSCDFAAARRTTSHVATSSLQHDQWTLKRVTASDAAADNPFSLALLGALAAHRSSRLLADHLRGPLLRVDPKSGARGRVDIELLPRSNGLILTSKWRPTEKACSYTRMPTTDQRTRDPNGYLGSRKSKSVCSPAPSSCARILCLFQQLVDESFLMDGWP